MSESVFLSHESGQRPHEHPVVEHDLGRIGYPGPMEDLSEDPSQLPHAGNDARGPLEQHHGAGVSAQLIAVLTHHPLHRRLPVRGVGDRLGIDLSVGAGEIVALLGASGSGKTTILRMAAGLETPDAGEVRVVAARSVVFQEPRLVQSKRVWQNVILGLRKDRSKRTPASDALREVGLEARADDWPATLSGGEAQRVALARALVRKPDLLLLDEPFAALDALTRVRMQQLLLELLASHDIAALMVTHDVNEAVLLADRILVLKDGNISLEQVVGVARPRSLADGRLARQAASLLAELGLIEPTRGAAFDDTTAEPLTTSSVPG